MHAAKTARASRWQAPVGDPEAYSDRRLTEKFGQAIDHRSPCGPSALVYLGWSFDSAPVTRISGSRTMESDDPLVLGMRVLTPDLTLENSNSRRADGSDDGMQKNPGHHLRAAVSSSDQRATGSQTRQRPSPRGPIRHRQA